MLTTYVGVEDPSGRVMPLRNRVNRSAQEHTHVYVVDTLYRCLVVGVQDVPDQFRGDIPAVTATLPIRNVSVNGRWTLFQLSATVPSDTAALLAEYLCDRLSGKSYSPRIPVPHGPGDAVPWEGELLLSRDTNLRDDLISHYASPYYMPTEAVTDTYVRIELVRSVCPFLARCLTDRTFPLSSDPLYYIYYAYASKLKGLPLDFLTSHEDIRTTLPTLRYVPTCRFVMRYQSNVCKLCPRYSAGANPVQMIAAAMVADRMAVRLNPATLMDMNLEELSVQLDPLITVDGRSFLSAVKVLSNSMGLRTSSRDLHRVMASYRAFAASNPIRRLIEAYRVRQTLLQMVVEPREQARIILDALEADGASLTVADGTAYIGYKGRSYPVANDRNYLAFISDMIDAGGWGRVSGFHQALSEEIFRRGRYTTRFNGWFVPHEDGYYYYKFADNPMDSHWVNAETYRREDVSLAYSGPTLPAVSSEVTSLKRVSAAITGPTGAGSRLGFVPAEAEKIYAFLASTLFLALLPKLWLRHLHVLIPEDAASYAYLPARMLSLLLYGEDVSTDLEPYQDRAHANYPVLFSSHPTAHRHVRRVGDGTVCVLCSPEQPEQPELFRTAVWKARERSVTMDWLHGTEEWLRTAGRASLWSSMLTLYNLYGYDRLRGELAEHTDPQGHLMGVYLRMLHGGTDVTKANTAKMLPLVLTAYWRKHGALPLRKAKRLIPGEMTYAMTVGEAWSCFAECCDDLGLSVGEDVTARVMHSTLVSWVKAEKQLEGPDSPYYLRHGLAKVGDSAKTRTIYLHFRLRAQK